LSGRFRRVALCLALALGAGSCATVPRSGPAPGAPPAAPARVPPAAPRAATPSAPAAPAGPLRLDGEPLLDVGLATDLDSVTLALRGTARLASSDAGVVGRAAGALRIVPGEVPGTLAYGTSEPLAILSAADTLWVGEAGDDAPTAAWNGRSWRGTLKLFVGPRGRITLAARLPLEVYLRGVVPLEIGGLGEELLEAGRAQAVAARSYTLFYRGRRAAEGFDLFGTVEDQAYGPVESERPLATQCVERTRGEVALYDGQPIRANYGSTCGGMSAAVWEAWPVGPLPYLESRRDADGGADYCAGSSLYRWRERWSADELLENVARFAPAQGLRLPAQGTGQLIDVRADARSRSGRVWRLRVRTTTMDLAVPAWAVRAVLRRGGRSDAILRSDLFKIDVRRAPDGTALEVVASGAGAGHGVGLCQTGALGMARAGAKAERILAHYPPRPEPRRLY
jgi:stage II sporulation protein D